MQFNEIYTNIQFELKAPKGQFNSFAKYHYRSCEDILEAVKPLLHKYNVTLTITDEVVLIGDRYYVKATATLRNSEGSVSSCAFAREQEEKKGLDESQITGTASSYARKYALNGLFCIDDTKDADTMDNTQEGLHAPAQQQDERPWMTEKQFLAVMERIKAGDKAVADKAKEAYRMKKEYRTQIDEALRK